MMSRMTNTETLLLEALRLAQEAELHPDVHSTSAADKGKTEAVVARAEAYYDLLTSRSNRPRRQSHDQDT